MKQCSGILSELENCIEVLPGKRVSFKSKECERVLDSFRECIVLSFLSESEIERARLYVRALRSLLDEVVGIISGRGWALPRETSDFIKDPLEHLKKEITLYTYDLLRGKLSLEEYTSKTKAAVSSSMRSNMRTVYEVYILALVVKHLAERGARLVYPEHKFIHFDRHGKQVSGTLPPNLVVEVKNRGLLSFYLEAPRPLGWRDFKDLQQVWRFYTILRPDIMVYSGLVLDIVDLSSKDLPVKKPDVIIECKELSDWYLRKRELKGPVNPSLDFSEWFKRWISGLWSGLADVLDLDSQVVKEITEGKRRGIRVSEIQLVQLYSAVYKPRKFYLVSAPKLPENIVRELEDRGIVVYDGVDITCRDCLGELAEEILGFAKPVEEETSGEVIISLLEKLRSSGVEVDTRGLLELLVEFAESRLGDFVLFIKEKTESRKSPG